MPQTKTQPSTTRKAATPRKRPAANNKTTHKQEKATPLDRTTEFSQEALKSLESGQRAAIDAVRKFIDVVDEKLPALGERPSRRQEVIDAAMEMADHLVHTQYDFIRNVVHSAGKALNGQEDGKK